MSKMPYPITEEMMHMLADIFRVVLKEIKYDEDKEKLAPGEIGISYTEGCLYVRNPHTGELFCPNSIAHINQILNKFNSQTGLLNADCVGKIRFYSHINQLDQLGITLSMDSIIRQMAYPGILMSPIEYENPEAFGFPSDLGMLLVHKISTEFVMARFYDCKTFTTYEGRYNTATHEFDGWAIGNGSGSTYLETKGGGSSVLITGKDPLSDMMILTVRVTETLNPGATLSYNGGEYLPILNQNGANLDTSIGANNIIMLIYDELRSSWIWLSSTDSPTDSIIKITNERLETVSEKLTLAVRDYQERFTQLAAAVEQRLAALDTKPGNIVTYTSKFVAPVVATDTVNSIADFNAAYDKLVVNYNQTILRPGIDYVIDGNGIQLVKIKLNKDDVLQFIVIKQAVPVQNSPLPTARAIKTGNT